MTFFESGGTDSPWQRSDDPFSRVHRERRRRRVVVGSTITAMVAAALSVVVVVVGPGVVARSANELFMGAPPPPSAEVVALADKTFLTEEGRELLYASRPRLASIAEVAEACQRPLDDPPAGCWASTAGLFVSAPADARIADSAVTTLAHELLHAAYDQLGAGEIFGVHGMLEAELARVPADDPVHGQIEWSVGGHEVLRETELFAYLGTQFMPEGGFAPELEAVYARYFTDRAALVAVHHRVIGVVDGLFAELEAAYEALADAESANAAERVQLDIDRQSHEVTRTQYNSDADRYNQLPESERAQWMATWVEPDGASHSAPLGESLARRLASLEQNRVDLDARAVALQEAEAAAAAQRADAEARYADLATLSRGAGQGQLVE